MRKFLASVGNGKLLGKVGGAIQHIADIRTLTESTLSFSSTQEEVRAGQGAQLYGRFAHDSAMTCTLTDAMFDMNYIALQVGSALKGSNTVVTGLFTEPNTQKMNNHKITLTKQPQDIGKACGLDNCFVWVRASGCNADADWIAVPATKNNTSVTIPDDAPFTSSDDLCVQYFVTKPGKDNRAITVNANFIPAELILVLTTKLFSGDANNPETGKPVGEITVKIPRFSLDGTFDLSMAMSAAATLSLQGSALAVDDGTCDGTGVYAEIVQIIESADGNFVKDIKNIIADADTLEAAKVPEVYAMYNNGNISEISSEYFTITKAGEAGPNADDKALAGTNYIVVSYDGGAWSADGTTIQGGEYVAGEYKISPVTVPAGA